MGLLMITFEHELHESNESFLFVSFVRLVFALRKSLS